MRRRACRPREMAAFMTGIRSLSTPCKSPFERVDREKNTTEIAPTSIITEEVESVSENSSIIKGPERAISPAVQGKAMSIVNHVADLIWRFTEALFPSIKAFVRLTTAEEAMAEAMDMGTLIRTLNCPA